MAKVLILFINCSDSFDVRIYIIYQPTILGGREAFHAYIYIHSTCRTLFQLPLSFPGFKAYSNMPYVDVTSSTGKTRFKYTICTPASEEADEIDRNLPTLLFIHPVSIAEHIYYGVYSSFDVEKFWC